MPPYRYALLAPTPAGDVEAQARAEAQNAPLLGDRTLGVEVTEPALAARCGLGNIDPQHDGSGSPLAAIEAAAEWRPLPPIGATLVTLRPDLDALGAMAVLTYRAEGRLFTPPLKSRIRAAARADRFDRGPWPGPKPWPASVENLALDFDSGGVSALSAAMRDTAQPVEARVASVLGWLASGLVPRAYERAALERAGRLLAAIREGRLVADDSEAPGRMVEIVTEADGALHLGYRIAPVVLALNPRFAFPGGVIGPKYTIAQYAPHYADLDRAIAPLLSLEPGWGGSATIKGSPQGHPSRLARATVGRAVAASLKEGDHERHDHGEAGLQGPGRG